MKTILLFYTVLVLGQSVFSQSYLVSLDKTKAKDLTSQYDGSKNYLRKKVYLYIGQTLRFNCDPRHEKNISSFVLGFTVDYNIGRDEYGPVYPKTYHSSAAGPGTDYHKIVNNMFKVLDVHAHPWADHSNTSNEYNNIYYLELYNLTLRDTAYYEYFAFDKDGYFPFIVTKHYRYLKNKYQGQYYQVNGKQDEFVEVTNFETWQMTRVFGKSWWRCMNIIINKDNCELSLILERNEEKIIIPLNITEYLFKKA